MQFHESTFDRRTVVKSAGVAAAAVALAGCSTYGDDPDAPATSAAPAQPSGPANASGSGPANALVKTADVPVGGGVIVGDTVVTQPTAGQFKGMSSTCTHAGCKVSSIESGKIVCPCHGSKFNLDGSVSQAPAQQPLAAKNVRVEGDSVVLG